jgi:CotH protein
MRAMRSLWAGLAMLAVAGLWSQPASADEAATLYDPSRMHVIKLSLPQKSREELAKDRDKYQPGTLSLAESVDGTPDHVGPFSTPVSVEMKLKGSASYRPLSGKSAFKIRFPQAQPFRGLRYMTLNNMVEDPSMIHETLAYTAFRGSGVPASRTGYAYVYVDGADYGVHLNIETLDKVALAKIFGSFDAGAQHLYEGENGADAHPSLAWKYEVDEGDAGDLSDLEELVEVANASGPLPWASRVAAVADLQEMTRMWAVEKYIGQWDGYAGQQDASWLPNNHYLYSDPNGVFQMLPWGNDESFQNQYRLPFDGRAGLLFDLCLDDEACNAMYRQSVAAVRDAIVAMDLDALAVDTAAFLAPWQALENDESDREEWGLGEIAAEVAETRDFIASRPAEATEWLGRPASVAKPAGSSPAAPGPDEWTFLPPVSAFKVGRTWVANGVLRTAVRLRAGGTVTIRIKIPTGERAALVCRDQAEVKRPRHLTLLCRLPASVQERLRQQPLDIKIAARFVPHGGQPETISRRITLPRQ